MKSSCEVSKNLNKRNAEQHHLNLDVFGSLASKEPMPFPVFTDWTLIPTQMYRMTLDTLVSKSVRIVDSCQLSIKVYLLTLPTKY